MRVTGKDSDDHWARVFVKCPSVYLNGIAQNVDYVVEADDICGYVVNIVVGVNGMPMVDRDHFVMDKLYGIVEIFGTRHDC